MAFFNGFYQNARKCQCHCKDIGVSYFLLIYSVNVSEMLSKEASCVGCSNPFIIQVTLFP